MDSVYGRNKFDSSRGCWHHSFQTGGDSIEYCMIAAKPEAINADGGIMIYLQAYSDPQAEIYSQVEPGLEGLFLIEVGAGKKWRVVASNPAIDRGQAGDCGCLDSKLIEVGPSRYGWLSTMGGVWQGIQATHYSLQVPIGSKIRDVSNIPRVRENSPGESNTLEVERNGEVVAGMYPLKVTLSRGDSVLETRLVAYDEKQGFYPWKP
ncbi:hypothetical protein XthCFBP4691_19710 [Xanthomonas theicola]|uniref:Uncharacterized protein n=1 Tax=Xanthomonas theicola TaxID=56464 RepID=A0A2S6Z3L8_9XANT|nr:hypothetical protein XthCFBP4691_19710 [Xanthomonas theicola]QNH27005.1 hypothetical protein G4Q83_07385 [Xanthomonas theicola]